jgi:guanylate kinase
LHYFVTMSEPSQKIIIITAPSGSGKTSITRYLMQKFPQLSFSVSATTRLPRPKEQNGVDYYFLTTEAFKSKIDAEEFIEYEMVYQGVYYGTLKTEMNRIWNNLQVPVLDIDVKGAMNVMRLYPGKTLSLFIEPPSLEELENRLKKRGTETSDSLLKRITKASEEMAYKKEFDVVIVNDVLEIACNQAEQSVNCFLDKT